MERKQDAKKPEKIAEPEIMQLDFRVWGTKEQLMGLRQYLINNNIKFGKVEVKHGSTEQSGKETNKNRYRGIS